MKVFGISILLLVLLMTTSAEARLQSKLVEYRAGGTTMEGYLAYDDSFSGKRPGVIVFPEWYGINDYSRMRAEQLAAMGYVAFAADPYGKGVRPTTNEQAGAQAGKLKADHALIRERANAALGVLHD